MYLHSVSAYADQIIDQLDESSHKALQTLTEPELYKLHFTWGMAIRNEFGLWMPDHPLTKAWHAAAPMKHIVNGIDEAEDHPDHISMLIMKAVWKKVNA